MTTDEGASEGGRRRRRWSDEDKVRIVTECDRPGASVSLDRSHASLAASSTMPNRNWLPISR